MSCNSPDDLADRSLHVPQNLSLSLSLSLSLFSSSVEDTIREEREEREGDDGFARDGG